MNTLTDLELALRDLERCAPDLDHLRTRLAADMDTPRRHWRQVLLPAAAAVLVAAIAVVAIVLSSVQDRPRPIPPGRPSATQTSAAPTSTSSTSATTTSPAPTATPAPTRTFDLSWRFVVHPVPGYVVTREVITAEDQQARVTVAGNVKDIGGIDVYSPGVVPSELGRLRAGAHVQVHGHPGYFAVLGHRSATVWQYAGGAWAEVSGDWGYSTSGVDAALARAGELKIARAIDTAAADPLRIDFSLGYVPRGLHLSGTNFYADFGGGPLCELDFVDALAGQREPGGHLPAVTITRTVLAQDTGQPGNTAFRPNTTVGGRPASYSPGFLAVRYPGHTELDIAVDANHITRYPEAELVKIAQHASPAGAPAEPGSWTTGDQALPR